MTYSSAGGTSRFSNTKGSDMKEIDEEIKQTLNLMQTEIDDGRMVSCILTYTNY